MFNFTWCAEAKIWGQLLLSLWHVLFSNHIERCLYVCACMVAAPASEPYIYFLVSQCFFFFFSLKKKTCHLELSLEKQFAVLWLIQMQQYQKI